MWVTRTTIEGNIMEKSTRYLPWLAGTVLEWAVRSIKHRKLRLILHLDEYTFSRL